MEPAWVVAGVGVASSIFTIGGAYGVIKFQLARYEKAIFASDGRLNIVPSIECDKLRTTCSKDLSNQISGLRNDFKEMEQKRDKSLEKFTEFYKDISVHMQAVHDFMKQAEREKFEK